MRSPFLFGPILAALLLMAGCRTPWSGKEKAEDPAEAAATGEEKPADKPKPGRSDQAGLEQFLAQLRTAVAERNMEVVASLMTPNFGYQLEPPREGEGVFQFWDEHGLWEELALIVQEPFVEYHGFHVAPPVFAESEGGYTGYRAGIRKIKGKWKFVYFVNG